MTDIGHTNTGRKETSVFATDNLFVTDIEPEPQVDTFVTVEVTDRSGRIIFDGIDILVHEVHDIHPNAKAGGIEGKMFAGQVTEESVRMIATTGHFPNFRDNSSAFVAVWDGEGKYGHRIQISDEPINTPKLWNQD